MESQDVFLWYWDPALKVFSVNPRPATDGLMH